MTRNASEIVLRIVNYALLASFVAWFFLSAITVAPSEQELNSGLCLFCLVAFASFLLVRTVVLLLQRTKSWYEILFWPVCILAFVLGVLMVESKGRRVPQEEMAEREMFRVEGAIREHFAAKGELPRTLSDIRDFEGGSPLTNVYGNTIEYLVTNKYEVLLRAYGYGDERADVKNLFVKRFAVREE